MAYLDQAGFVARFGQTELDQVLITSDGRTFAAAADDASAIIDSYLASVPGRTFTLPLASPPARVIELASDLARYKLWGQAAPEIVTARYQAAIKFLEMVAKGELSMVGLEPEPTPGVADGIDYVANDRVFTEENLAGF